MERRFREYAGLLTKTFCVAVFLLSFSVALGAESGPEEALVTALSAAPEEPSVGGSYTITVLVNHPAPAEVSVKAPAFPASFRLERTRVEPRLLPGRSGRDERWTAIEYSFTLSAPGEFPIGRFAVRAASKRAETAAFVVLVSGGVSAPIPASLSWQGVPDALRVGESAELALALSGTVVDQSVQITVSVPENAIFRNLPVSAEDRLNGRVARFRLTPLERGSFRLPSASVRLADGKILRAPERTVVVSGAAASVKRARSTAAESSRRIAQNPVEGVLAFPDVGDALPRPLRPALEAILGIARNSWGIGDRVSSLALLRAAERDSPLGLFVRPVRKEAEAVLGLSPGRDEPFAPFTVLVALSAVFLAVSLGIGLSLLVKKSGGRSVTSGSRRRFMMMGTALVLALICASRLLYSAACARESVVLSECRALRVPDPVSARSADFSAGQSARVTVRAADGAEGWLFVEAEDGRSGWIRDADARHY